MSKIKAGSKVVKAPSKVKIGDAAPIRWPAK